jgi:hypothetical protein
MITAALVVSRQLQPLADIWTFISFSQEFLKIAFKPNQTAASDVAQPLSAPAK